MSFIDQLRNSLERRLATLNDEIAALEAARHELARPGGRGGARSTRRVPVATRRTATTAGRSGVAVRGRSTRSPAGAARGAGSLVGQSGSDGAGATGRVARRPSASRSRRLSTAELTARVEELLRESPGGASLVALAKRAGASEARVREVLQALDHADRARSSGGGRTSLWRLVDEEQLIAERAAELERLSANAAAASSGGSPADGEGGAGQLSSTAGAA